VVTADKEEAGGEVGRGNGDGVIGVDLGKEPAEKGLVWYGEDGYVWSEEDLDEEGYEDEEQGEKDCEGEVSCVREREKLEIYAGI
jgi:hypothetical protein